MINSTVNLVFTFTFLFIHRLEQINSFLFSFNDKCINLKFKSTKEENNLNLQ